MKTSESSFKWYSNRVSDGVSLEGECRHIGNKMRAEPNTLEYFLFERYSLYTELNGKLHMAYTLHKPWEFREAEISLKNNSLTESYNLGVDVMNPQYVHSSKGVYVLTWPIEEVKL